MDISCKFGRFNKLEMGKKFPMRNGEPCKGAFAKSKIFHKVKESVHISEINALVYIMNINVNRPIQAPSLSYYEIVHQGYLQNDLEVRTLAVAAIKAGAQFDEVQIVEMGYE